MTPDQIAALFIGADGRYRFARWGRPIVPVVFGVDDATLPVIKGAIEAVVQRAGHQMTDMDAELGANLLMFFFRDWDELPGVPNLTALVPDLAALCARLQAADANQYRSFRRDETGAIRAAFVFVRLDGALADTPAEVIALAQAVQVMLLWADGAFAGSSPLGLVDGVAVVRPEIAAVIQAGYNPVLPMVSDDPAHAYRLAARVAA